MADHRGNFPMRLMKMMMMHWCSFFLFLCQMHLSLSFSVCFSLAQLQLSTFLCLTQKSLECSAEFPDFSCGKRVRVHFFHTRPCRLHYSAFWLAFFRLSQKKNTTEPHRPREKSDSAYIRRARTHKTTHDRETVDDDVGDGGDI